MTQPKQAGWAAAIISLLIPCFWMLWPEPQSVGEHRAFPRIYGTMWLMAVSASVVAGRLLAPRWYYLAMFWVGCAVTLGIVTWLGGR
jgi:hypothetical protein